MTRRKRFVPLALFTVLAASVPAQAQLAPSRSGYSTAPVEASEGEYWAFMRELGFCLARSKTEESVAFLQSAIDSPEEARAFCRLINRHGSNACMRNMVRATLIRSQVRGVVAEGLFERQPASTLDGPVPTGLNSAEVVRSIHDFARCYVARNFAEARALLADTRLGTEGERDRVRELSAGFGPCLPEGREVRIVPIDIRMALAEALYDATSGQSNSAQGSR